MNEGEKANLDNQPTLCRGGCGFFANPTCNGMCSKCYRDAGLAKQREAAATEAASSELMNKIEAVVPHLTDRQPSSPAREQAASPAPAQASEPQIAEAPERTPAISESIEEASIAEAGPIEEQPAVPIEAEAPQPPKRPQRSGRCYSCNKKVGLTGFQCRCGFTFCGAHRLAEQHECDFDYKKDGRMRLAANNPLIQANKVDRM